MSYTFPYSSQRMPVLAKNIVATSQPLAAQAGLQMLLAGGNAVDAALATAMCLTVVEPTSNGIGSDAFCILWDGTTLHGLNASGRSPKKLTAKHFEKLTEMPLDGWDSVTVPGCVSAWVELSKNFGKLPFEKLFEPAIHYARDGFLVSPITAASWQQQAKRFQTFPEFYKGFMPNGRAPLAGELFRYEEQGRTLEQIASSNGEAFYRGALADAMVADAKRHNALLDEEDLATHQADWVGTISQEFREHDVHEIPPNGQGLAALIALGILEQLGILQARELSQYPLDSANSIHAQLEAMKLALADVYHYVSDPSTMTLQPKDLLDKNYLAERAKRIDMKRAQSYEHGTFKGKSTVYLSTADASGMMVSFIQSNYYGFGSGIVVPGTGISLQNRGYGFTVEKGHPNEVGGGKRPFHTIIPSFVTGANTTSLEPVLSYGVMGGPMQAQGHVQMVVRVLHYGQNPQTASDAPRWRILEGLRIAIETGFPEAVLSDLEARGHMLELDPDFGGFGGAQLIQKISGGYSAGSDHRKDGLAVGF
ncbi:MAG: gamma-glutamyltransferase family protein [Trueperaceae bacterium]